MTDEMFRTVFETAGARADKDGWIGLPDGRHMTLHAAHDGVPLTIGKVEAVRTVHRIVTAKTSKGELYVLSLDDLFAAAFERGAETTAGRKAGFLG